MKYLWMICLIFFSSCSIQGPWDYDVEDGTPFAGIFVSGQLVAGKPIENICFERMYTLDEMYTTAFAFYQSAQVQISGKNSSGVLQVQVLQATPGNPNCFQSDMLSTPLIPQRGENYALYAKITWDSAGKMVTTELNSQAHVPTSFSISDSARASSDILSPGTGDNLAGDPIATFNSLPTQAQSDFLKIYGDTLSHLAQDTAAFQAWVIKNGQRLATVTDSLLTLYDTKVIYRKGDTVYFLWRSDTRSHQYKANASSDVGSILLSQRFEDEARIPQIGFMTLFDKSTPKPETFYYKGTLARLESFQRIENANFSLFDTLGVVNTWFVGGKNVLYFYGMEPFYNEYEQSVITNADNPLTRPRTNVVGGMGYFVGSIVDSFTVNIKIPPSHPSYSFFEARAAYCASSGKDAARGGNKNGWDDVYCREFKASYCKQVNYSDSSYAKLNPSILTKGGYNSCLEEKIRSNLEASLSLNTSIYDSATLQRGIDEYCYRHQFAGDVCKNSLLLCQAKGQSNSCKTRQRNWCEDQKWLGTDCDWTLALYCKETSPTPKALCANGVAFCSKNPTHPVCVP